MADRINVMVNGLPGKMASRVADYVNRAEDLELFPFSLTGPEIEQERFDKVHLVKPRDRDDFLKDLKKFQHARTLYPFISVDFTQPSAVNTNAEFYCRYGFDFVMGTTGGDRKLLEDTVIKSRTSAVIAPNMAKPIVLFQSMIQYAAENFPDAFRGYSLEIVESHQKGKADTSGTALSMVEKPDGTKGYFNLLGMPFKKEQIKMIRDPKIQLEMGIPEVYLTGHGWHTYALKSEDDTVLFRFTHNVNGRGVYAVGTLDAIRYLQNKVKMGHQGQVYSMIDVLKGK